MDHLHWQLDALQRIVSGEKKPDSLDLQLLRQITGNFSDDRRIGEGGCGQVYKGILPNGVAIAVKKLKNGYTIDEKMFLREVDSMIKVGHPNIVRFIGYCSETKEKALQMEGRTVMAEERERLLCFEYIGKGSIDNYLNDELRGFEWYTRYQIIKGICYGLLHLHKEKCILHMDLKPANILLTDQMVPKITDFGLSRIEGISQTTSVQRLLSPGYCAPEYIENGKRTWKSDIYSLGVIMIELVTGSRQHMPNLIKVLRRWRHRWSKSSNHIPLWYQQVKKCLELALSCKEKNPINRPFIWDIVRELNKLDSWDGQIGEPSIKKIISSSDDMLGIEPLELHFTLAHDKKQISCGPIELTNDTDYYMAFRIATASRLPFSIHPDKGIAAPRSKCTTSITLSAQEMTPLYNLCDEEFIVQSTRIDGSLTAADITVDMFDEEGRNSQKKTDDGDKVVDEVNLTVRFDMLHEEHQKNPANYSAEMGSLGTSSQNLLEVQVYATDSLTSKTGGTNKENFGDVNDMNSDSSFGKADSMGLIGLQNIGNTCFMNSSIQCLAHTPELVDYFFGDYAGKLNWWMDSVGSNNGELALAFGEVLRSLWTTDRKPVVPFHLKRIAPQFSGFNQHDSQEFLTFLLAGLHEDLNQVKCKPYEEAKDASGRPDEEVADEYWSNHLARNNSVIVDTCHGQYKSTLTCPTCSKTSVTFDLFMFLCLPVPSTAKRVMTVTVFSTDGSREPYSYDVSVPKFGTLSDLVQALSSACLLGDDETLLVTEVYNNCIIRYLEEPSDSVSLLRDGDKLAAYRLPKRQEKSPLVVFTHQHFDEHSNDGNLTPQMREFEAPLLAALPETINGLSLRDIYLKLLSPFQLPDGAGSLNVCMGSNSDPTDLMGATSSDSGGNNFQNSQMEYGPESSHCTASECEITKGPDDLYDEGSGSNKEAQMEEFEFYLKSESGDVQQQKIEINDFDLLATAPSRLHVSVHWLRNASRKYATSMLNNLPEIHKLELTPKGTEDSVTLHGCLEAFLKEEILGPEDMWYCPYCKKHQQAMKKLDLWRLPEVLMIHLKRFSYTQFTRNKLETFVDFPTTDLDLSSYIADKRKQPSSHYRLYAISNHYGNMGGGHYTAIIYHEERKGWYKFDDDWVTPISEDRIKTPAAYVLFYRRESD